MASKKDGKSFEMVKFDRIISNDYEDDFISFEIFNSIVNVLRKHVDENSIILDKGIGPSGRVEICVNFLTQKGLYHLCVGD